MSVEDLERLAKLRDSGALTEDEFQAKKASILSDGVDKPKKKKSKLRIGLNIVGALLLGSVILNAISNNSAALAELPECDSGSAKETLAEVFNQSQFARSLNLSSIGVNGAKRISDSEKLKTCSANIVLNNTNEVKVDYELELREGGKYMLTFEVRE